ncbi:beta-phosphoglucomutase [Shewanella woodyi]|uniref:Beta-phosphoglucomutase n=1 Tax=Shewanella woodyi (strain ATCC 51908 / MS32) TaxID=392500 RepID=B1KJQ5_SHEWM|nr:beta-phosphoglucomutase [Shewanella woodyi]ACA85728.1 beta-phosphoglucomutase [Shewanella woodyi ATCC 51908]
MALQAAIFDLDGVLTDTAEFHFIAWQSIAQSLGVDFSLDDNEKLKGVDRHNSLQHILNKGNLTIDEQAFNQLLDRKNKHYLSLIASITPQHLFEGVLACFTSLKARGIKIGLASASKNATLVLNKLGIESLFDFVGDAASVKNSKPAPDIFLSVAAGLGVDAHDCMGIEDAAAGVTAIKSAKMYAVGIGDKNTLCQADQIFTTFNQLNLHLSDCLTAFESSQHSKVESPQVDG